MTQSGKWAVCPKCNVVQPVGCIGDTWIDYGGTHITECFQCEFEEGPPYQFDADGWAVDDPTEEEKEEYRRLKK